MTYTWERDKIKPVANEPSMPRVGEVTSWLEISSLDSWQDIAHRFWDLQHPQTKSSKEIKSTVDELIQGKTSEDDKARAIYDWVATKTRYVGLEFGISAYRPHSASEVRDKQYGDCKDKANLLITMLGVAGIKAHPVFLHADERRAVDTRLPTVTAFDHCIALAQVNGKDVWLDATADTCPYGDIPMGTIAACALWWYAMVGVNSKRYPHVHCRGERHRGGEPCARERRCIRAHRYGDNFERRNGAGDPLRSTIANSRSVPGDGAEDGAGSSPPVRRSEFLGARGCPYRRYHSC